MAKSPKSKKLPSPGKGAPVGDVGKSLIRALSTRSNRAALRVAFKQRKKTTPLRSSNKSLGRVSKRRG